MKVVASANTVDKDHVPVVGDLLLDRHVRACKHGGTDIHGQCHTPCVVRLLRGLLE